ncbi:MAG: DUF2959 domain-containing protein [Parvularculaceae bacterium]
MMKLMLARHAALAMIAALVAGCATAYYSTLEQFGIEKRDVLVDRVKDARGEQAEAQKVFASALDEFRSLVEVDGGKLERRYDKLNASYKRADQQATDVRARIKSVNDVGRRLFREWETELKEYESADLKARSERQLTRTKSEFEDLMFAMNRAAEKMDPVLALYNDQVLFLKHNLNARAISSLDAERAEIESRVETLIDEMNAAIAEADAFIANLS